MAKRQAKPDRAILLRDGVYHLNQRTPRAILQLYPDEPPHTRRSLETSSIHEARERRDKMLADMEARWGRMLSGDPVARDLQIEADWHKARGTNTDGWYAPPGVADRIAAELEALAESLGLRERLELKATEAKALEELRRHPEGARLLNARDTAGGRLSWSAAGEEFLKAGTVREGTATHYRNVWAMADRLNLARPQVITRRQALEYLERRRDEGLSASSLNSIRSAMTKVMRKLYPDTHEEGSHARREVWKGHEVQPRADKRPVRKKAITAAQLAKVLTGMHWSVSVATKLACYSGLRMGELYSATWDFDARMIRVPEGKTEAAERDVPLHPHIEADARRWVSDKTRYAKATLRDTFSKRKRALELPKNVSFHSTRHAFVSAMARAGVEMEIRERIVGHEVKDVNARYTHYAAEDFRPFVEKVDWSGERPYPWTGKTAR